MKFHAMLPVRDEADIIEQCLEQALKWADAIYVLDSGSSDNTWELVQELATRESRVKPFHKGHYYFNDRLVRGWLFDHARRDMKEGDWFVRMDADEFHHMPPPEFVKTQMRPHETLAYHQYYDFRLTASEVAAWERGEESLEDRRRPIETRRRHYTVSSYTEPRLCRYRSTMQ